MIEQQDFLNCKFQRLEKYQFEIKIHEKFEKKIISGDNG
jgi:hypothetical protein